MGGAMNLTKYFEIMAGFLNRETGIQEAAGVFFGKNGCLGRNARGLEIYQNFASGVALQAVFPRLKSVITKLFGGTEWDELAKRYFKAYPARHFELNMNGVHFPEYLQQSAARANLPPWTVELADFEWWEWQTLTTPDDPDDATPLEGPLRLGATVELRPYTHDLIEWCDSEDSKTSPVTRTVVVMFWRDANLDAWRRNADHLDLELLRLVHQNEAVTPFSVRDVGEPWDAVERRITEMTSEGILLGRPQCALVSHSATVNLSAEALQEIMRFTTDSYGPSAQEFFESSLEHDVSQNCRAFLNNIEGTPPFNLLDLGCGSGRDLKYFRLKGHDAVGLDGAAQQVEIARSFSECEVYYQDFMAMTLPESEFDGIFANASLFHVPSQAVPRVLQQLWRALKRRGILFTSNPLGENQEGWVRDRYAVFYDLAAWSQTLQSAGFERISYYHRPTRQPETQQKWLATLWRRNEGSGVGGRTS